LLRFAGIVQLNGGKVDLDFELPQLRPLKAFNSLRQ
jgi:hypothetical protein